MGFLSKKEMRCREADPAAEKAFLDVLKGFLPKEFKTFITSYEKSKKEQRLEMLHSQNAQIESKKLANQIEYNHKLEQAIEIITKKLEESNSQIKELVNRNKKDLFWRNVGLGVGFLSLVITILMIFL